MILTAAEIEAITDLKQAAAQIRWLTRKGWRFVIGANGHPKVLRAEADRHMLSAQPGRRARSLNLDKVA